jgi:basic amino acid/polyamine antiporter, APA family
MPDSSPLPPPAQLRRELGKWDLTAIGVNQVIGGAVFAAPTALALALGAWSWCAVGLVGLLAMAIALNFAEAGSRTEGTGGPYLYTREAFGRFAGFEVGWIGWLVRVTSWASILDVLVNALGYYWPGLASGTPRAAVIATVVVSIAAVNIRGIRQSSWLVNAFTIGKLTPLVLFVAIGLPQTSIDALRPGALPPWHQISTASLLLIFVFGGYEIIPVPAGEARSPRTAVPFAMIATIVIVACVMTLAQGVAVGTFPGLAGSASTTPLADAARIFIGPWGAALMIAGATVSVAGNNVGAALSGSRILFALAEQGDVPRVFGHVSARFRTPDVAIVTTCATTLALALTGSFVKLAAISAIARLLIYGGTCASVLALRRRSRAPFTIPWGPLVPAVALVVCAVILAGATAEQVSRGGLALGIGAGLYLMARRAHDEHGQRAWVRDHK